MIVGFWCLLTAGVLSLAAIAFHHTKAQRPLITAAWVLVIVSYFFVVAEWRQL